jgi:hypothetical protein
MRKNPEERHIAWPITNNSYERGTNPFQTPAIRNETHVY